MQTSCSFTERCSGIPSCVAEIKTPCPLRLAVSLPPGLPFTLNCALALDRSPAQTEFCKPALCSIKGNVPGRKHRERTGGRFQSAGAEQGDLLTAARVAKSPWQRASDRFCTITHSIATAFMKTKGHESLLRALILTRGLFSLQNA